jgi:hypothetical protein
VVSRAQLLALEFTRHAIQNMLDARRLHPVWPGVYAVGHARLTWKGRYMAGVLACGPGAVLSHRSAGVLHALLRGSSGRVHVTTPEGRRTRPGLRVYEGADICNYATTVDGIPAMTVARTLLSLAATVRPGTLARAIEESERLQVFDLREIDDVLDAHPGARGSRRLREALAAYRFIPDWTRSGFEDEFLRVLAGAGLPLPAVNNWVEGHEVDCVWFEEKLVVELDGGNYHQTTAARIRDPHRDADLQLAGFAVHRVTDRQLALDPGVVIHDVRRLLTRPR